MARRFIAKVSRALLCLSFSTLLISCASHQAVENVQTQIDGYHQDMLENQQAQSEIREALVRLEIAGEANGDKATALRKELVALEAQNAKQAELIRKVRATVSGNAADIKAMKTSEDGRKKAVERLNQSYEKIEQRTSEKLQDINSDKIVAEGEQQ